MSTLAFGLAAATLAVWLVAARELVIGGRRIATLAEIDAPRPAGPPPRVSVVIAARDEAAHLEAALRSVLALDLPELEVVAVDDRSSDGTGALLDALARGSQRLTVVHVTALPEGWLGKNHALAAGARAARGDWLLFTDADVHFAPDALARALAVAEAEGLDHLALGPRLRQGTPALGMLLAWFALSFALTTRPWRAADPGRAEHIGIGAFNLLRRRAYDAIGGFERIRLRPDDDLKLGKLVKDAGLRQRFMAAGDLVQVAWYRTAGEMFRGLEKNAFAFLEYSVARTLAAVAAVALLVHGPLLMLVLADGATRALAGASVALTTALALGATTRAARLPAAYAFSYPVGALMMIATILNSMARALAQGGVRWRGTLYPLAALRANRI